MEKIKEKFDLVKFYYLLDNLEIWTEEVNANTYEFLPSN